MTENSHPEAEEASLDPKKYYSFGDPATAYRGDFLKWFKEEYYAHPPSQEQLDLIWNEWEDKMFANRIILDGTLRLKVHEDFIHVYDLMDPKISVTFYYPPQKSMKKFLNIFSQQIIEAIKRGEPISKLKI